MQVNHARTVWSAVPQITFGTDTNFDPANAMFSTTNLPGASTQNITDARRPLRPPHRTDHGDQRHGAPQRRQQSLRVSRTAHRTRAAERARTLCPGLVAVHADADPELRRAVGTAAADGAAERLVLDVGVLRPLRPVRLGTGPGGRGCNIFQPGTLTGSTPQYVQYDSGNPGYDTDWNNFAPNVGAAWRPNVQGGWLRALLGDPDQATIRAGYSVAFTRERMDRFTNLYSANPGAAINANRTGNQSNLVLPGESWPITLSQQSRLGPPAFPDEPGVSADAVARQRRRHQHLRPGDQGAEHALLEHRPAALDLETTWRSTSATSARGSSTAGRPRTGTRSTSSRTDSSTSSSSRRRTCAPTSPPAAARARTRPAPSRIAAPAPARRPCRPTSPTLRGFRRRAPATSPSYTGVTQFTNSAWTGHLGEYEPDPVDAGNDLHANATFRANALAAGLPANFFVMNPDVDQANITRDAATTKYDALQIDFRRRLSQRPHGLGQLHLRARRTRPTSTRCAATARVILADDGVPHAFKTTWYYESRWGAASGSARTSTRGSTASSATGSSRAPAGSRSATSASTMPRGSSA